MATPERIKSVIEIVRPFQSEGQVTVVFSAFGGVTDMLIHLSDEALHGDEHYKITLRQVEDRHLDAVRALIGIQRQNSMLATVKTMINQLEDVIHGIFLVKERTLRMLDFVMSFGERLSAYIISEAFRDANLRGRYLETTELASSYTVYLDTLNGMRRLEEIRMFRSLDYDAKKLRVLALTNGDESRPQSS